MANLTAAQANVLAALKGLHTRNRRWISEANLSCFDGRTVRSLVRKGLVEIDGEHGARVSA